MQFPPTPEQQAILDAYLRGDPIIVIESGAGAGKTTTLRLIGEAVPEKKGIYFAFGKAIAEDAKASFPKNVYCATAHSLAYGEVITRGGKKGQAYKARLAGGRMKGTVIAQHLGINEPLKISEETTLRNTQVALLVMQTVSRFCHSADEHLRPYHVPFVDGLTLDQRDDLRDFILPYAEDAWEDIQSPLGVLKFDFDHYLKIWQLSHPKLNADFILFDEAQDADPVIAAIIEEQTHLQRILVGDACQAIYGWRGAVDAMDNFNGTRLQLTQSFRFGPAVAEEANKWLGYLQSNLTLRGFDKVVSTIAPASNPDAILCRTNAGALEEVLAAFEQRKRPALVGGGNTLRQLTLAAKDLKEGRHTEHPDLFIFENWGEVLEYVDGDSGGDLKVFVKMVEKFGIPTILRAVDGLVSEEYADVIVSTAHKAKGREWNTVRIANDFFEPKEDGKALSREEAMLAYVAVTRAKIVLDRGGLGWIDGFLAKLKMAAKKENTDAPMG